MFDVVAGNLFHLMSLVSYILVYIHHSWLPVQSIYVTARNITVRPPCRCQTSSAAPTLSICCWLVGDVHRVSLARDARGAMDQPSRGAPC